MLDSNECTAACTQGLHGSECAPSTSAHVQAPKICRTNLQRARRRQTNQHRPSHTLCSSTRYINRTIRLQIAEPQCLTSRRRRVKHNLVPFALISNSRSLPHDWIHLRTLLLSASMLRRNMFHAQWEHSESRRAVGRPCERARRRPAGLAGLKVAPLCGMPGRRRLPRR